MGRGKRVWPNERDDATKEVMMGSVVTIEQEVLGWLGVTSAPGRFGAVAFRYGKRQIGHVHRDR